MNLSIVKPGLHIVLVPLVISTTGNTGNSNASYVIGGIIAILILAYLVFSLLKPDKF